MYKLKIVTELQIMLAHLKQYQKINVLLLEKAKQTSGTTRESAGSEYAYGNTCRRVEELLTEVLEEVLEIKE
jgi:hypothetical protein